jgi:NTE family protein
VVSADAAEFLQGVPIFAGLDQDALERLAEKARWVEVVAGDWLFREGDTGGGLYVLRSGRLEVVREAGDAEVVLRALRPGAVLGELAVLTGSPRSASVRCRRDSRLVELSNDAFLGLMQSDPEFATSLTRTMASQLQASRAVMVPKDPVPPVIAVLTLGRTRTPSLAEEITDRLGPSDRVKLLTAEEAAEDESLADALDRWERSTQQVVLEAGGDLDGEWGMFCRRQADRLLISADGSSRPRPIHSEVGQPDLVLLDWPRSRASLVSWTELLDPRSVHLIDEGEGRATDLDVLARKLAGRSPGVVLSGGGARGLAHIGVMDELRRADVPIDRIGGCSMGAIVGALFACGLEPDEVEARIREELVERNPISDYTLPLAALVRGRKAEAMLLRLFGDRQVEELPHEFFCVSSDLVTSELVVHRRGPLYVAVGASVCLPGIGPPVASGERLLVDGGVLNNLPVEAMAARGEGPVIAVDVSSRFEPPTRDAAGAARPRMRRLSARVRRAIIGWDAPLPSLGETLTRTIVLGSIDTAEAAHRHADVVIAPAVQGIGLTEFARVEEIRAQGAAAARETLERMPAELLTFASGRN